MVSVGSMDDRGINRRNHRKNTHNLRPLGVLGEKAPELMGDSVVALERMALVERSQTRLQLTYFGTGKRLLSWRVQERKKRSKKEEKRDGR